MKNELYDSILNMDIDSETVTGVFADDDNDAYLVVEKIAEAANVEHRANCKSDRKCRGTIPYLLKHLKIQLTSHEEYTSDFMLALVAGVFVTLGREMVEGHNKINGLKANIGKPDKMGKLLKAIFGEENVEIRKFDLDDDKDE